MENTFGKISIGLLLAVGLTFATPIFAEELKLTEVPLSQLIELYSKATGRNVFVDETVQQGRKVTAHLQDMSIEDAFEIVQKTIGLESTTIGPNTTLLYPPERAQRYRPEMKPFVFRTPPGIEPKWLLGIINSILPSLKATPAGGDQRAILFFGPETEMRKVEGISRTLPELALKTLMIPMSEQEAKTLLKEMKPEDIELEAAPGGLMMKGAQKAVHSFRSCLDDWRAQLAWGSEVFTPENLVPQAALKAAETLKTRALIGDLGGTGSILVEGPQLDRERVLSILRQLDQQAKKQKRELLLGEVQPEMAKDALKGLGVETVGERRMVLIGKNADVETAASILKALGQKKKQVVIQFRLAEIATSRLKTLGIDLDKTAYSYGEIKEFHPKDMLPLLLRVLHEGKDGKILAEPNIRVIEGEEARVTIGDRIPLEVAATAQTDSGSVLKLNTQLDWVDVGIKMSIGKLTVNPDDSIKMTLKGEVSSVVSLTKQGYPQIRTREAESTFRIDNGGMIVMGGLLSREERKTNTKIPVIGNIPLFGGLVRGRDRQNLETEIIMLVTANLVKE